MSFKRFGGWVIEDKLYVTLRVANELWTFTREKDDHSECQTSLLFIGWFDRSESTGRLFTINILWFSMIIGFNKDDL